MTLTKGFTSHTNTKLFETKSCTLNTKEHFETMFWYYKKYFVFVHFLIFFS